MNELAVIFDRMSIDTKAVLEAAGTKWNFLRFHPGLVGGHCIGVDPYYLTAKAEELGINPQVILAGRRINDSMGAFVAHAALRAMGQCATPGRRVAVLGLAFKENVRDPRNSRVPDIVEELRAFGCEVLVHDPLVDVDLVREEYGLELVGFESLTDLAAIVLAVPHTGLPARAAGLRAPVFIDVRGAVDPATLPECRHYWRL
jgi:UDP-N-acetyl-D-galactosamine dehydrogenase